MNTRLKSLLGTALCAALISNANAGMLVGNNAGAMGGNDTLAKVLEEIDEYNAANDPDLIDPTGLFKKSDGDAAFVFNPANGFAFYQDAAGMIPVLTEGALTSLSVAYFEYTGTDANLLYYSAKGPSKFGFSLFTFMPGLNQLDLVGASNEISHVSFWEGPPGLDPNGDPLIPEPGSLLLTAWACLALAAQRRALR
ncbi:hypothetical protein MalM25_18140 [Planctomycetes bacterium MalM25]|nr:hypothetical protein MalM25_18140 [Planctomycetes bacterium MalM25]